MQVGDMQDGARQLKAWLQQSRNQRHKNEVVRLAFHKSFCASALDRDGRITVNCVASKIANLQLILIVAWARVNLEVGWVELLHE